MNYFLKTFPSKPLETLKSFLNQHHSIKDAQEMVQHQSMNDAQNENTLIPHHSIQGANDLRDPHHSSKDAQIDNLNQHHSSKDAIEMVQHHSSKDAQIENLIPHHSSKDAHIEKGPYNAFPVWLSGQIFFGRC